MLISLIKYLIDPFTVFWLLLIVTFISWYYNKGFLFKLFGILSTIWFLLIATPFLPNLVLNSLESQYRPLNVEEISNQNVNIHIVVLGAGHGYDKEMPANTLLSPDALTRLNEGIRLLQQIPRSKLILSGYSSVGNTTGAEMMKKTALLLGVDIDVIILQNEPVDTYEEAVAYAQKYRGTHPVILVTSAAHMPRAMRMFKAQGIEPIPSPTYYRLKGSRKNRWIGLPEISNIEKLKIGIYEYSGMLEYELFKK